MAIPSHDVVDACNAPPYTLPPGASLSSSLVLGNPTPHAVLVSARAVGAPIEGATITLSRPGFSSTTDTSACGAAYFGGVASASDYTITASAPGYANVTANGIAVSGQLFYGLAFE